jgi:hypothetical protein
MLEMIVLILQIVYLHFSAIYLLVKDSDTLINLILHLFLLIGGYHLELILECLQFFLIMCQFILYLLALLNHVLHLAHQVVNGIKLLLRWIGRRLALRMTTLCKRTLTGTSLIHDHLLFSCRPLTGVLKLMILILRC